MSDELFLSQKSGQNKHKFRQGNNTLYSSTASEHTGVSCDVSGCDVIDDVRVCELTFPVCPCSTSGFRDGNNNTSYSDTNTQVMTSRQHGDTEYGQTASERSIRRQIVTAAFCYVLLVSCFIPAQADDVMASGSTHLPPSCYR